MSQDRRCSWCKNQLIKPSPIPRLIDRERVGFLFRFFWQITKTFCRAFPVSVDGLVPSLASGLYRLVAFEWREKPSKAAIRQSPFTIVSLITSTFICIKFKEVFRGEKSGFESLEFSFITADRWKPLSFVLCWVYYHLNEFIWKPHVWFEGILRLAFSSQLARTFVILRLVTILLITPPGPLDSVTNQLHHGDQQVKPNRF